MLILYHIIISILVFFFGASIASFIGVICYRTDPNKKKKEKLDFKTILSQRSRCDHCAKILGVIDLVPVFSFLFLRGKCRKCYKKIDSSFLIIEIISGLIFIAIYLLSFVNPVLGALYFVYAILIASIFIFLAYYDYLYWEVPLGFVIFFAIILSIINLSLGFLGYMEWGEVIGTFGSSLVGIILIACFIWLSNGRGLGWGDAWIFGIVGLMFNWEGLMVVFFISTIVGALFGVGKIVLDNKKFKGTMIQFIPFISTGVIVMLLDSKQVIYKLLFPYQIEQYYILGVMFLELLTVFIVVSLYKLIKSKI